MGDAGIDLERLKAAAEEAQWLCARGYAPDRVAEFVARERTLAERERLWLACAARADAHHRHHIARELDPEDVARRPIRLDAHSVLGTVAAALRAKAGEGVLLESAAGLLCDPEPRPDPAREPAAAKEIARALAALAPSAVVLFAAEADAAACATLEQALTGLRRVKIERQVVASVAAKLRGAANVASADPAVLDECGTWLNLAGIVARELGAPTVSLS
jgi:hypothetical protein